jgi:hypothetical protein
MQDQLFEAKRCLPFLLFAMFPETIAGVVRAKQSTRTPRRKNILS